MPSEIVIFDTEYTAWEGSMQRKWSGPNEYREIIQIGAVIVDTTNYVEKNHMLLYVRPVKNPILSEFIIQLTGISQKIVDSEGLVYPEAIKQFKQWVGGRPLFCWGIDVEVMAENATLLGTLFPFSISGKTDIRPLFAGYGIDTSLFSSGTIPRAFGETPPAHAHDALNDARSILQALQALKRKDPRD